MKIQQEVIFKHCNYLEEVLNYIHVLVPNDMKSEILEDWYKVLLKVCEALQSKFCNVSLVVDFGRFIGKSWQ